jgi:hypothetical protein
MSRTRLTLALAAVIAALAAPAARATIIEIGTLPNPAAPSCPGKSCRVLTRTTGYQTQAGNRMTPVTVPQPGRVVGFTVTFGDPTRKEIHYFNQNYGGTSRLGLSVLAPDRRRALVRRVIARSGLLRVQPFFGGTTQFVLGHTLRVRKGQIVAITTPTWAPILAFPLSSRNAWRASRARGHCDDYKTLSTLYSIGAQASFACRYTTARLTYTVTMITDAQPRYDRNHRRIKG